MIGVSALLHNVVELQTEGHWLSLFLLTPFVTTSLALLWYNWYPSQVFVGDTYTYWAGMVLAVCGILGHYSKTLILFFIPQVGCLLSRS